MDGFILTFLTCQIVKVKVFKVVHSAGGIISRQLKVAYQYWIGILLFDIKFKEAVRFGWLAVCLGYPISLYRFEQIPIKVPILYYWQHVEKGKGTLDRNKPTRIKRQVQVHQDQDLQISQAWEKAKTIQDANVYTP